MEGSVDVKELEKLRSTIDINNEAEEQVTEHIPQRNILLEPALVGVTMAINLGQTSLQNFYLQTACNIDLQHPLQTCNSAFSPQLEAASQQVVSGVNISRSFIGALISTIVLLFVGPWSDCSGRRKPLLIMTMVGMCVMTTSVLLMVTFPGASTVQVLYAVQMPMSFGGNFGLLLAAAFSYIGDHCHATGRDVSRTMGTHRAAMQVAHVVGSVSGPLLYRNLGYYGVFPIVLLLQLSSLLYVLWTVKDVNVNKDNRVSFINWRLPFNAVHCLIRPREGRRRVIIILMLIVALGDRMFLSAEVLIAYMYYRYKFGWDDILFGSFIAYRNIVSFLGTLLILTVLKKCLRLSDEVVGVLSCISYVLATSGLIFAKATFVVFIVTIVGIIAQGSQVVQRPILNKQILPNEQGKIYSVLGALESATITFSSPLYSLLYERTVSSLPDAWLFPGIALAIIQLIAYLITRRLNRSNQEQDQPVNENEIIQESLEIRKFDGLETKDNTRESLEIRKLDGLDENPIISAKEQT